jgi:sulfite reductase (NADPH) flavoprotein alpha-component
MLAEPKLKILSELIGQLNKEELIWVNGYLSGLVATSLSDSSNQSAKPKITIAYGTETGNAKKLATDLAAKAKKKGIPVKLASLDQYKFTDLPKEEYFITVISTQGDGEPPVGAKKFYDHIHNNGFKLPQLKYGVLALGDTAYPLFCKTGEDVDKQFEYLGGQRIAPLQKCDLDYEADAHAWFDQLVSKLHATDTTTVTTTKPTETKKTVGKQYYDGTILTHINLTARGSSKKVYHIEIAAEDVEFIAGDSIGIVPENDPELVQEILSIVAVSGDSVIEYKGESYSIQDLLTTKVNIRYLLDKSVKHYSSIIGKEIVVQKTDLLSLLKQYPLSSSEQFFRAVEGLTQIVPRIYNISSSPAAHPHEIHITVLQDVFETNGITQRGLCTQFLENKKEGDRLRFFIQTNKRFRLPVHDKDIIMIGPGTGVAPFRSFVSERDAIGATGRNWLFFSEDQFTTDFLYQTEWQAWFETETLTRIHLSFKNGEENHTTLAQKIIQQGTELFQWLEGGANLYICGEKEPAGKEIEAALLKVFAKATDGTNETAIAYLEKLKKEERYAKDLY